MDARGPDSDRLRGGKSFARAGGQHHHSLDAALEGAAGKRSGRPVDGDGSGGRKGEPLLGEASLASISRSTFEVRSRDTVELIEPRVKLQPPKGQRIRPELRKEREALLSVWSQTNGGGATGMSVSPATTWSLGASPSPSGNTGGHHRSESCSTREPCPCGRRRTRVCFVSVHPFISSLSIPFFLAPPRVCRTGSRLQQQDNLTDYALSSRYRSSAGAHFTGFKRPQRAIQKVNRTSRCVLSAWGECICDGTVVYVSRCRHPG